MNEKEPPAGFISANDIARIRQYYRRLGPEAAEYFSPDSGRWPENRAWPALNSGPVVGFLTTTASMVAFLDSIVPGSGQRCWPAERFGERRPSPR